MLLAKRAATCRQYVCFLLPLSGAVLFALPFLFLTSMLQSQEGGWCRLEVGCVSKSYWETTPKIGELANVVAKTAV